MRTRTTRMESSRSKPVGLQIGDRLAPCAPTGPVPWMNTTESDRRNHRLEADEMGTGPIEQVVEESGSSLSTLWDRSS